MGEDEPLAQETDSNLNDPDRRVIIDVPRTVDETKGLISSLASRIAWYETFGENENEWMVQKVLQAKKEYLEAQLLFLGEIGHPFVPEEESPKDQFIAANERLVRLEEEEFLSGTLDAEIKALNQATQEIWLAAETSFTEEVIIFHQAEIKLLNISGRQQFEETYTLDLDKRSPLWTRHPLEPSTSYMWATALIDILRRDATERDAGRREREPYYQDAIIILLQSDSGKFISLRINIKTLAQDCVSLSMPLGTTSLEKLIETTQKILNDFRPVELQDINLQAIEDLENPLYRFKGVFISKDQVISDKNYALQTLPLIRRGRLEITVRDRSDIEVQHSISPDDEYEEYHFPRDRLVIETTGDCTWRGLPDDNGEFRPSQEDMMLRSYVPSTNRDFLTGNVISKFWKIIERILEGDKIVRISTTPLGMDEVMTPNEALQAGFSDFRVVKKQVEIHPGGYWGQQGLDKELAQIIQADQIKISAQGEEKRIYAFQSGENEQSFIIDRSDADSTYIVNYLFTKVRYYPQGITVNEAIQEIEETRVM